LWERYELIGETAQWQLVAGGAPFYSQAVGSVTRT
jgi:hypothetical protein